MAILLYQEFDAYVIKGAYRDFLVVLTFAVDRIKIKYSLSLNVLRQECSLNSQQQCQMRLIKVLNPYHLLREMEWHMPNLSLLQYFNTTYNSVFVAVLCSSDNIFFLKYSLSVIILKNSIIQENKT